MRIVFFLWTVIALLFNSCSGPDFPSPQQEEVIRAFNKAYDESLEDRNPDSALFLAQKVLTFKGQIHDKEIVFRAYTNAALAFERLFQPDSAALYYQKTLYLAYETENPEKIAFALQLNGNSLIEQNKYRLAEKTFREALELNNRNNRTNQAAANYAGLGLVNSLMARSDSAIAFYLKALDIFKQENDVVNQSIMLGNIAAVFNDQELYQKARDYLRKAIQINDSTGNLYNLSQNYNSLGIGFANTQQLDSAFYYYHEAILISQELQNPMGEIISEFNLAKAKTLKGNYSESNSLLRHIYQFCDTNQITEGMIRSLIQIAENERLAGNITKAHEYLNSALEMNTGDHLLSLRIETLYALSMLAAQNYYTENRNYLSEYKTLRDSLSEEEMRKFMLDTEAFYHKQEKEKQIELLKNRNKIQKISLRFWIVLSLLLLSVGSTIYYVITKKQKQLRLSNELALTRIEKQKLQIKHSENEIALQHQEVEKNKLARKLKEQEIVHQAISYSRLIHTFHEIRDKLNSLSLRFGRKQDKAALDLILQQIDRANGHNPVTEVLNACNELHPDFYPKLSKACPALTPRELQICALISLNMTTKEIAVMLSISDKSIEIARHRIRKKLNLDTTQNLTAELLKYVS